MRHAIESGYLETGAPYLVPGFASHQAAEQGRQSVNNAARHLGVSCSSRKGEDVFEAEDGTWTLRFRIFSKASGRRHIASVTGGDPSKLAYNPFERKESPMVNEYGQRISLPGSFPVLS